MKTQLTTTKSTTLALSKTKSLMGITAKILEGKGTALAKAEPSQELTTHEGIVMIDGLMWEKETQEEMNWDDAMEYAKNLRLGGYDDWRLPTPEELGSVVTLCGGEFTSRDDDVGSKKRDRNEENETYQEAYKKLGFVSSYGRGYWSSATECDSSVLMWDALPIACALLCDFNHGYQYYFDQRCSYYVRCVRAGQ